MLRNLDYWQGARYAAGQHKGHYESWFLRGNHPQRNEAFWIRYTIFSPHGRPRDAIGELWVIHFDGERGRIRAAKDEIPIADCHFAPRGLNVKIGGATLAPGRLQGRAGRPHRIAWDLTHSGDATPMVFLPESFYEAPLPKAKAVSQRPCVVFNGTLTVDDETIAIDGWTGSENHNWGSKHTDTYAWGQVVGFDGAPDAFFEAITARLKFGPLWTPPMTIAVLRVDGADYKVNTLGAAFRAQGGWQTGNEFRWQFDTTDRASGVRLHGTVSAPREAFVGLTYYNPPGGSHTCLNSKIAACEVTLERPGQAPRTLRTAHRAAFEILTDDRDHGVPLAT